MIAATLSERERDPRRFPTAIADTMNYTIDELRAPVAGVHHAALHVTQKTAQAHSITAELLGQHVVDDVVVCVVEFELATASSSVVCPQG